MKDVKEVNQQPVPHAGGSQVPDHPVDYNHYLRRCLLVFAAALCMISLMVWASYLPPARFSWPAKAGIIVAIACCNAFVVAGFLMHLISEKKMIYTILAFTVFLAAALMWLTVYAMQDFPSGTLIH